MTINDLDVLGISPDEWAAMGPIERLYLDVSQLLGTLDEVRWIELECGQLEIPEESYPVQFPCVLIDFPEAQFENETHGNQQGLINVQLRLGIDLYEDLHMVDGRDAPDKGMAIKRLALITRLHKLLHGFETDYSTKLVRTTVSSERRDDGIKVFSLLYGCAAKDDTAADVFLEGPGLDLILSGDY
jgi:hypothetical protein